jgi:hypothetical protein
VRTVVIQNSSAPSSTARVWAHGVAAEPGSLNRVSILVAGWLMVRFLLRAADPAPGGPAGHQNASETSWPIFAAAVKSPMVKRLRMMATATPVLMSA